MACAREAAGWPLIRVDDARRALGRCRARLAITADGAHRGHHRQFWENHSQRDDRRALCNGGGSVCATRGNLNNEIGLPLSLLTRVQNGVRHLGGWHEPSGRNRGVGRCARPGCAYLQHRKRSIEHFGSAEAIAFEKAELLRALPSDGAAVLCRSLL